MLFLVLECPFSLVVQVSSLVCLLDFWQTLCLRPFVVAPDLSTRSAPWEKWNQSKDKKPIDSVTKKYVSIASHFSHGDSLGASHQFPGIYRVSLKKWKSRPCFVTKSVKFRSFEEFFRPIENSRRDLQSEHGFEACSLKHKGKRLDFHTFRGQKSETKTKQFDEIGQMLVFWAENLSKWSR